MRDRVVILDPSDTSVSVNLFEKGDGTTHAINETIGRITRIFNTISVELTQLQQTTLTFALRAILSMEQTATIDTLIDVLRNGIGNYEIPNLSRVVRSFFENDFKPNPKQTDPRAGEIIARLNGLLADPTFEALFGGNRSTFDMFQEMQKGKLIVIDASKANHVYGRFWIEEVARTIRPRLALDAPDRMPTSFIVDEAQNFIAEDLHFSHILDEAREARMGMFVAAHHMGQITNDQVRHSMYTNMAIKMVANTSADIFNLCRSMGKTEADFITTLGHYEFAFFGPGMQSAKKVKLPLVEFDRMPRMSREEYSALRNLNRRKYGYTAEAPSQENAFEKFAHHTPLAIALEGRRIFEDAVRGAVIDLPDCGANMPVVDMIRALYEHKLVDGQTRDLLHKLRLFGNKTAHNMDVTDLSKSAAIEFREAVDGVVQLLGNLSPPELEMPVPKDDGPTDEDTY